MIKMTTKEVVQAVRGNLIHLIERQELKGISIDSRSIKQGDLFIAIKGECFDGHDYIDEAIEKGAVACIIEDKEKTNVNANIILVDNTLKALHELAHYYKSFFNIPFIAITGSSGKTTTKDMIASVLKEKFNVLKTQGNYNNEIGLPLTLFKLEPHHEIAVLEMGMSSLGEISDLVHIVNPDISVITNIGSTHIENLGSRKNILKAKMEILETLKKGQIALLNGDDPYLKSITSDVFDISFVGIYEEELFLKAQDIKNKENKVAFSIQYKNKYLEDYRLNLPGIHNIYNSLMAIYIGKHFNLTQNEIQQGLDIFKPSEMRMDIFEVSGIKVIDDVYNANPDSMKAALNVLRDFDKNKRKIAIMGDMLEMGKWASEAHLDIGRYAYNINIDILLSVGQYAKDYIRGALEAGMTRSNTFAFNTNREVIDFLKDFIEKDDVYLIKGSRGIKMEEIVTFLRERS